MLKVRISQGLVSQDPTTKDLVVLGSASVYLAGTNTLATLYSDEDGTALSNPVPTGVTPGSNAVGLDTTGNLIVWVDPGNDYELLLNGEREPLSTPPSHGKDTRDHINSTDDPHGAAAQAMAYADATFLNRDTDISGLVQDAAIAYLNANIGLD